MKIKLNIKALAELFVIVALLLISTKTFAQEKIVKEIQVENYLADKSLKETVLVKVGDKTITVREFYERAEYTIRPRYAKGKSELDKKIILNSLIAEKLIALERGSKSSIHNQKEYKNIMDGRKGQVMRQILFHEEGYSKVKIDSAEFVREYKLAGRSYDVEFINFDVLDEAEFVADQLRSDTVSFSQIFYELSGKNNVPTQQIVWNSPEHKEVTDILFKGEVKDNQVFGPVKLDDSYLVFKVIGWTDKPAITETDQMQRYKNVDQKLKVERGTQEYIKFIKKVMSGKKIEFDKNTFNKLVRIMAPLYDDKRKQSKENFASRNLDKKTDMDKTILEVEENMYGILNEAVFTIDGQIWTVGMYEEERQKHPLVFPSKDVGGKKFAGQLKMAIVDMIQDKYLTEVAYERNYDKAFIAKRVANMWSDALISFYEQIQLIKEKNAPRDFTYENIDKFFKPYIDELQEKYSDVIEINIEEFKKIKLTSIDFLALQKNVPYPIIAPSFPMITTDYHLDYGKKMEAKKDSTK
ncbi:MAG: hypothetical protein JEY94_13420 [Melioribacteraceae bacterium]|nr:hypothetical protein [Melioribacteraceae bacterium]